MRIVFPILPGTSRKYNPPLWYIISCIILLYAMSWSGTILERFVWKNVRNLSTSIYVSYRISWSNILFAKRFSKIIPNCVIALLAIDRQIFSIQISASLYTFYVNLTSVFWFLHANGEGCHYLYCPCIFPESL